MASNPLLSNKFIYQFGNIPRECFVFYKGGFRSENSKGLKERVSDASYIDGEVDNALNTKLNASSKVYNINFNKQINDTYTTRYIEKMFDGRKDIAFFFETDDVDIVVNNFKTTQRYIDRWYFTSLRTIQAPTFVEEEREDMPVGETKLEVVMKAYRPYYYDCTDSLEYIDYDAYVAGLEIWDSVGTQTTWSATTQYWSYPPASYGYVSALSDATAWSYFTGLSPNNRKYFLQLRDRFFERDITQAVRNYYINNTFVVGTTDTTMASGMERVNSNASEYRIEIGSMASGQALTVSNLSNESGIKINWLDGSSSGDLVYNSIYNRLYNTSGVEINQALYTIEIVGDTKLYFTGLHNPFAVSAIQQEGIRIIVSSGGSLSVKIDVLEAYV